MTQLQQETYRRRAEAFVMDYLHVRNEKGEAHSFWDRFFEVFGLQRIRYANYEARVKRDGNRQGFIDLLWKGKLLVEHKSASKDRPEDSLTKLYDPNLMLANLLAAHQTLD